MGILIAILCIGLIGSGILMIIDGAKSDEL